MGDRSQSDQAQNLRTPSIAVSGLAFCFGDAFPHGKGTGYLYLLTDHSDGEVLGLEPTDEAH